MSNFVPPSPMRKLIAQGLNLHQAAKVWGLRDKDDQPLARLAEHELSHPGTYCTSEQVEYLRARHVHACGQGPKPVPRTFSIPAGSNSSGSPLLPLFLTKTHAEQIAAAGRSKYGIGEPNEWGEVVKQLYDLLFGGFKSRATELAEEADARVAQSFTTMRPRFRVIEPGEIAVTEEEQNAPTVHDQVLDLANRGYETDAIAEALDLSTNDVERVLASMEDEAETEPETTEAEV